MLKIATPALTPTEWREVKQALNGIAGCGCAPPPRSGSVRARIGKAIGALTGQAPVPVTLPPRLDAVRRFACESGRLGRVAQAHVPTLAAQGFSPAQIDAIALLGA
jgi:hypothetical protein